MKLIRNPTASDKSTIPLKRVAPWKILVVDDDVDVRRLTALNLRGFAFMGRPLQIIEADSAVAAKEILQQEGKQIAMALIDVVMENDHAGLQLVEYIRQELGNRMIRLVIRTGQPGVAPEREVIDNFDINDYKDKTELTAQKLYSTVRNSLRSYRDLQTIEMNRVGLARILEITPELYNLKRNHLEEYFRGVLTQLIGICNLGHSGMISTIDGLVVTVEEEDLRIQAGTGELSALSASQRCREVIDICCQTVRDHKLPDHLRSGALVIPLEVKNSVLGFIYLEASEELSPEDRELIHVMVNQCAAALENFRLHYSLEESYEEAIDMLGLVAEFKDSATGTHIRRIQEYTRRLALKLGSSAEEAELFAKASRLHDVGKVGIPDHILRKPGALDDDEYDTIKRHTLIGDTILKRSPRLATARHVARFHHEKWNGRGYPDALTGEEIPLVARIVAVVDVFDALVSVRPYKGSWSVSHACAEIAKGAGHHFDPQIAQALLQMIEAQEVDDLILSARVIPSPQEAEDPACRSAISHS
jgi:response regulator RpfG family c-di-GMP phosphodiesterase